MSSRLHVLTGIDTLGLPGRPICLHSSLRSFGTLDGGASALIDAFLDRGCTLLVPTFSYEFEQPPPADRRYARNGWDYVHHRLPHTSRRFDPDANVQSRADMGAIPAALLERPDRRRGRHPLNSFAAVGELADELIAGQTPYDVYAPLVRLCDLGGAILLVGVDLTSATFVHLAEADAGREPFRRWALDKDGRLTECRVGSCSRGFGRLQGALAASRRTTCVGSSGWSMWNAATARAAAATAIRGDPSVTSCERTSCLRCADAIAGGPRL
jgi:aminoglycoside 3-N-acetyltransferase